MTIANLFEHETLPARQKLNRIWDLVPATGTVAEIEAEFTRRAVEAGFTTEECEQFLLGEADA